MKSRLLTIGALCCASLSLSVTSVHAETVVVDTIFGTYEFEQPPEPTPEQIAQAIAQQQAEEQARADRIALYEEYLASPACGSPELSLTEMIQQEQQELTARAFQYSSTETVRSAELSSEANRIGAPMQIGSGDGAHRLVSVLADTPIYQSSHNLVAAETISVDEIWPGGSTGFNLTGSTAAVGVWENDGYALTSHYEFGGRVVQIDNPPRLSTHATEVVGLIGATGIDQRARGMSYQSSIRAFDVVGVQSELSTEAVDGLSVSNHSYGINSGWEWDLAQGRWYWADVFVGGVLPVEGFLAGSYLPAGLGATGTIEFDDLAYEAPFHLLVFSAANNRNHGPNPGQTAYINSGGSLVPVPAGWVLPGDDGDDGGYDTLSPSSCAKNILSVGAVEDISGGYNGPLTVVPTVFSSFGPTDDGRIKPDVVANGAGLFTPSAADEYPYNTSASGTSFSAPSVTGAISLLEQHRAALRPDDIPYRSSTMKALIIHTADEAGMHDGPDFRMGYGLVNAEAAITLLDADLSSDAMPHIKEVLLREGDYIDFSVLTDGNEDLKVTICWTDPIPDNVSTTNLFLDSQVSRLVHNLDLYVQAPNQSVWFPWVLNPDLTGERALFRDLGATRGIDNRNNVEQVEIPASSLSAGRCQIRVEHSGQLRGGEQWVSIIVSGNIAEPRPERTYFSAIEASDTPNQYYAMLEGVVVGGLYRLETTNDLGTPYSVEIGAISATKERMSVMLESSAQDDRGFYRIVEVSE